jgi:hypothetical protein
MEMENQAQVSEQNEVKADVTQHQDAKAEKTFSQEDVNNIVEKRLAKERNKLEKQWQEKFNALEESVKLSKMSEDEIKEHEFNKRIQALEERERAIQEKETAYNRQQYHNEIASQLQAKGLPTDLADLLTDFDAETVASKIASMEQSFATQVNSSIEAKIKASANVPTTPVKEAKPLTLADINNMTPQEIKAHKSEVEKVLLNSFRK